MALVITHVLSVCQRCMIIAVNGDDIDPDHGTMCDTDIWFPGVPIPGTEHKCEPWSNFPTEHIVPGVDEHSDGCAKDVAGSCDCEDLGFRQSPCDACGCYLHGDRFSMCILDEETK